MPEVQLKALLKFYNRKALYARSCESAIQLDPTQILEAGRGSPSPILGQTDLTGGGRSRQLSLRAGKSMDSGNGVGVLPHFEIIIYNLSNPLMGLL